MRIENRQFINGEWLPSAGDQFIEVIDPSTEEIVAKVCDGNEEDVASAVRSAKKAFPSYAKTTVKERIAYLKAIVSSYEKRKKDLVDTITLELGSPKRISERTHYQMGLEHFKEAIRQLESFSFIEKREAGIIQKEPIGVCALITPWNFPMNQSVTKVASALAAGCTLVLKPSEFTPLSAIILAEIIEASGLPKGVFNLVNGRGESVGEALTTHPDIDKISFTGSGETGKTISKKAADTIKKVSLELGGKSPFIVLDDFDLETAAKIAVANVMFNCGQVCTLASRTLIPQDRQEEFIKLAKEQLETYRVGNPHEASTRLGPLVSQAQYERVQYYIQKGMEEGATLVAGGLGKPAGLEKGYYVQPTIFSDVTNDMTIAQEEIFGPVMSILTYETIDEAISIANDTIYGLAAYILGKDETTIRKIANELRVGRVIINGAQSDYSLPFGGYKQSGIGREWGDYGINEYLEVKSIIGL